MPQKSDYDGMMNFDVKKKMVKIGKDLRRTLFQTKQLLKITLYGGKGLEL